MGESPESAGKSGLCGNFFLATTVLYLIIDIHLLQIVFQVRRIVHHVRLLRVNKVVAKKLAKDLELPLDVIKNALANLEDGNLLQWMNKSKSLVH